MSMISRMNGLFVRNFSTFGFNQKYLLNALRARSTIAESYNVPSRCRARARCYRKFSTSHLMRDKSPVPEPQLSQSSDVSDLDAPIVDLEIVEKQLQQILAARKKYLNDADFSRVFYEKLSVNTMLPERGLPDTYSDFVVVKEPRIRQSSDDNFSRKIENFNRTIGSISDAVEAEPLSKEIFDAGVKQERAVQAKPDSKSEHTAKKDRRFKNFDQELKGFIEACVHANLMTLARTTVIQGYFGNKHKRSGSFRFSDVSIYNVLLQAYASQGRMEPVRTLLKMMRESHIEANLQTHVLVLECLGRAKNVDESEVVEVKKRIGELGFTPDDILKSSKLTKESKHFVNRALEVFLDEPFDLNDVTEMYDNVLLKRLAEPADELVETNPYHGVVSDDVISTNLNKQLELEMGDFAVVKSIWEKESPEATTDGKRRLKQWNKSCRLSLRKAFDRNVKYLRMKADGGNLSLYPYMKVLAPDAYVDLMLEEIRSIASESLNYSPTLNFLSKRLGQKVMRKYNLARKVKAQHVDSLKSFYYDYWKEYNDPDIRGRNHRVMWQSLSRNSKLTDLDTEEQYWPSHVIKNVGKFLFDMILYETKLTTNNQENAMKVPAFYTIYRSFGSQTKQEIKPHPTLARLYARADDKDLHFEVAEVPMLVPPIPWVSVNYGGNLMSRTKLIRLPDSTYRQTEVLNATPSIQLNPVFDSLNTLSSCAWIINGKVLDILLDVFRSGGNTALDIPTPPYNNAPLGEITNSMSQEERSLAIRERVKAKRERAEMYSLWCNELYRLSIANQFRNEVFWFPHNMDFRGRVYPTPPHFNHLGSDVVRSMLLFAKGKPLGKHGLDWLKIHLINLTGLKKRSSNQERLDFANEISDDILDSADDPMNGRKWWQQSEEPWQTLAFCIEVAKATRSPDPEAYVCHIPVHQDGSFNGLQHYAALGRDKSGAESVNLSPEPRPCDVYSDVAEMVEKMRQKDAADGLEVAAELAGFIRRKVIKQTVMTTVYGVTKYGAKYQILRQLRYLDDFNQDFVWQASVYLTEKTFYCLREMFTATREIQDTLVLYAQTILKYRNKPLEWTTPLGLPVVQPYNKGMKNKSGIPSGSSFDDHPHAVKQKNAFPPNYIHSLDSTHMMLTALFCLRAGITYVSVHDCYWTHACDIDIMNGVCREQFVALHSQPILENLSNSLVEKYGYIVGEDGSKTVFDKQLIDTLGKIPRRGNFDLTKVLDSTYFFS